jgi:sugar O-acyltransferase (sialic acid O-acetyltransferase NeuD family)
MKKLAIYGAGGFGKEIAMFIELLNSDNKEWELIGFFDDNAIKGEVVNDYRILGGMKELNQVDFPLSLVIAVGNSLIRKKIRESITNNKVFFPTLIHRSATMGSGKFITIGEGCIISPGVFLTTNIEIGKHSILSLYCTVGHDTVIKDYVSIMPGVNISGEVTLGECVYIGTGAKIVNQVDIGEGTIVAAGAVVAKSLPANCTAVGIPAKPIKFNI